MPNDGAPLALEDIRWALPRSDEPPIDYLALSANDLIALLVERTAEAAMYRDLAIAAIRALARHADLVSARKQAIPDREMTQPETAVASTSGGHPPEVVSTARQSLHEDRDA